jgi:predicted transcriptional regulator
MTSVEFPPPAHVGGDHLDTPVRDLMSPGVLSIVEDASLRQVLRALHRHRVHAVLVSGRTNGLPLGWVTSRGLLGWIERDHSLAVARDAITEPAVSVGPGATIREAVAVMAREGVGRLLVAHHRDAMPEGVVSELDVLGV